MMTSQNILTILKTLPNDPGVYQYYDKDGTIIYVGKAKNLKKRVMSYFNKDSSLPGKVRVLVARIADIRWIAVESESDALLLENNMIKEYQPRYNIMLKDDKTYPWICIKSEPFPRVFPTRNLIKDGSEYFGPYASVKMMNTLLDLIRQLYPLRNCGLSLTRQNISAGKFKVCLEYHIGNCLGPCEGLQNEEDYLETIRGIRGIIKGNISMVKNQLAGLMKHYAETFAYEKAQVVKEKIELLDRYQSKSLVVNPSINNVDVFSIIEDEHSAYVNFVKVASGAIIQSHTVELKKKLDETTEELLSMAIADLHPRFSSGAAEIIVPIMPEFRLPDLTYTVPQRGDKKQLLELSERNAKYYQLDKQRQKELVDPERRTKRILDTIRKDLGLKELPAHMECFDNSNIQGTYPVAAMVVFRNARPEKKDYRHFNIKTVEGPDDFASMEEVVYRRYSRLLEEGQELPQLVIIDGGKGQLSSAMNSIEKLGLKDRIQLIGIAKRLEELYFPGDSLPLHLDKKSETLKVIQQMRDEAHRFGITHHRKRREKGTIKTSLSDIEGIGPANSQALLRKFKSVKNIRQASFEELESAIGKSKAAIVFGHFHPEQ
ncbi:MAG: excinuclease ABC subunit C [Bacteroidetes bacterium]|nr:MAG: excinuclease ABC subunit C [Bacteroidota bacterium]